MKSFFRALTIIRTASRYGLAQWLPPSRFTPILRAIKWLTPGSAAFRDMPRGVRLRLALQSLGPLFVKLGQVLSTRRDLLPADVADELAGLRDQVKILVGGAPITQKFADDIGADGYSDNAVTAVALAKQVITKVG